MTIIGANLRLLLSRGLILQIILTEKNKTLLRQLRNELLDWE
ncbi:unnamed protein product [Spirodela intermedia]|uniref:Uncharacterized protein n=2 Tax=Spirodela intermedia TaxID=51605 RepID=A0ABN7ECN7_SPIIN|nr:unnamed protein product [Spirodela intermedia]CAA7395121.1 unnamed protein product [Spirodela intermedia]